MKNKLNITLAILILAILAFGQAAFAQQGGLDTTFGTNNTGIYQDAFPILPIPTGEGDKSRGFGISEILADGKIIAAGNVTVAYINNNGNAGYASDFLVRRLNVDGSVDTTFGTNGEARTTFYRWGAGSYQRSDNPTYTMKVQPSDGKIILASMCSVGGAPDPNTQLPLGNDLCLVRYNQNGTLDTSFGGNTVTRRSGNTVTSYTMDAGKVWTYTGTNLTSPFTDTVSSGGTPVKIQIAPDGRIFVFGNFARKILTMASTPSAICTDELLLELFVPIISTAALGEMPSTLPFSSRHKTC